MSNKLPASSSKSALAQFSSSSEHNCRASTLDGPHWGLITLPAGSNSYLRYRYRYKVMTRLMALWLQKFVMFLGVLGPIWRIINFYCSIPMKERNIVNRNAFSICVPATRQNATMKIMAFGWLIAASVPQDNATGYRKHRRSLLATASNSPFPAPVAHNYDPI